MSTGLAHILTFGLGVVLAGTPAAAGVTIDLAIDPTDWTGWGSAGGWLGDATLIADVNGDGSQDLLVLEPSWTGPPFYGGRIAIDFGPLAFPAVRDVESWTPTAAIKFRDFQGNLSFHSLESADVDGDGIQDILVSDEGENELSHLSGAGRVYVFRGRRSWPATVDSLTADWVFYGRDTFDQMHTVRAGDLNGDGDPDLALFASPADGPGNTRYDAGEAYIVLGPASSWKARTDLAVDMPDVIIYGADGSDDNGPPYIGDYFGHWHMSAIADVTGDGIDDLLVGAPDAAGPGNQRKFAGEVVVLRGRSAWPAVIDTRVSPPDFLAHGAHGNATLGWVAAGDVDGDGTADLIAAAQGDDPAPPFRPAAGQIFVFRGGAGLTGTFDLGAGEPTARIIGPQANSLLGGYLRAADVNGDGFNDILAVANVPGAPTGAGGVMVISGCEGFSGVRDLAVDPADLIIAGGVASGGFGVGLSAADVDGDGRADIFAGAPTTRSLGRARELNSGEAHLLRGRSFFPGCRLSADAGAPVTRCGPGNVTLDGSASDSSGCPGAPQARWSRDNQPLAPWSTSPELAVAVATSGVYRLELRCGDCASGLCTDVATTTVTLTPDLLPADLGNTLRAVRAGSSDVQLSWGTDPLASSYALHRSTDKDLWPPAALRSLLPAAVASEPDIAAPPALYFYRAVGQSCSGAEGP